MPSNKCSYPQKCWYFTPEAIHKYIAPNGKKPKLIFNPKKAKDLGTDVKEMEIRCRTCPNCLYHSASEWGVRAACEIQMHSENVFITLTYAEKPKHGNLIPSDFIKFIKRLKRHHPDKRIRYLYSGERGGKYGRPHFHAILFGIDFPDRVPSGQSASGAPMFHSQILNDIWGHGLTQCGEANVHSAAYVAQYVVKKLSPHDEGMTNKKGLRISTTVNTETGELEEYTYQGDYIGMSRMPGIGHDFFLKYKKDIFPSCKLSLRIGDKVTPVTIPQYFYRIFEKYYPEEYKEVKLKLMEKGIQYALEHPLESSPERLLVKATCAAKKRENFSRKLDSEGETSNSEQNYLKALKIKIEIDKRIQLIKECDFPIPRLLDSQYSLAALANPDFIKITDYREVLKLPLPDFYQKRRLLQLHYKNEAVKRLKIKIETKQKMHYSKLLRSLKLNNKK